MEGGGGIPIFLMTKTDRHNVMKIHLRVAICSKLNTIFSTFVFLILDQLVLDRGIDSNESELTLPT